MSNARYNVEITNPSAAEPETDNYITLSAVQMHLASLEEDGGQMVVERVRDRDPKEL